MQFIFIIILGLLPTLSWSLTTDDLLKRRNHEIHRMWLQSRNYWYGTGVKPDRAQAYAWFSLYQASLPNNYPGMKAMVAELRSKLTPDEIQRGEAMIPRLRREYGLDYQFTDEDMQRVMQVRLQKSPERQNAPSIPEISHLKAQLEEQGQTQLAKNFWEHYQKALKAFQKDPHGRIVYGRVIVWGPETPREVASPIEILDDGYFVGFVPEYSRAVDFRLNGYMPVQYPIPMNKSLQSLGNVYLRLVKPGELAGIIGSILPAQDMPRTHVILELQPTEQKYQTVDPRPSWYWPTINVPLNSAGQFTLSGLAPARYQLIAVGPKGRYELSVVLRPGELRDLGVINFAG